MPPLEVLRLAKELEREAGRELDSAGAGREPWGPRSLDVDLLVYADLCGDLGGPAAAEGPPLTLPHPRLRRRAFVLVPLAEVAPGLPVPPDGRTVAELLTDLGGTAGVDEVPWDGPAR